MIEITNQEVIRLYIHLRKQTDCLDDSLGALLSRLEQGLFAKLSIEDVELIQNEGIKNIDDLAKKL
jgi:hypothetical protein